MADRFVTCVCGETVRVSGTTVCPNCGRIIQSDPGSSKEESSYTLEFAPNVPVPPPPPGTPGEDPAGAVLLFVFLAFGALFLVLTLTCGGAALYFLNQPEIIETIEQIETLGQPAPSPEQPGLAGCIRGSKAELPCFLLIDEPARGLPGSRRPCPAPR
jgi:hypothetical protein